MLAIERGDRLEALVGDQRDEHAARIRIVLHDQHALGQTLGRSLSDLHPPALPPLRPAAAVPTGAR
jgi:hypothetical protein